MRTTIEYVAFLHGTDCLHVELAQIARVRQEGDGAAGDILGAAVEWAVLAPLAFPSFLVSLAHRDRLEGVWESAAPQGALAERLQFSGGVYQSEDVAFTQGRYRLDNGALYLDPDSGSEQVIPVTVQCMLSGDALLGGPIRLFHGWNGKAQGADAPIVGEWRGGRVEEQVRWELREDGTYRTEAVHNYRHGKYRRAGHLLKLDPGGEFTFHREHGRLLLIGSGGATEYQRAAP